MPLNHDQILAVDHFEGPCMVLAGPGSGKTTVIVKRIETLIKKYRVLPEKILVITFTRAAAHEMRERFLYHGNGDVLPVTFGTFHSVFYQILRTEFPNDDHRILSESERYQIFRECVRELYPSEEANADLCLSLMKDLSDRKNHLREEKDGEKKVLRGGKDRDADCLCGEKGGEKNPPGLRINSAYPRKTSYDFKKLDRAFTLKKQNAGAYDFDDLLTVTYELLRDNPKILEKWRDRFRFILVDEFQDINPLQYAVVKLLAAPKNNLFIVGDDDQSIYEFRGSAPRLMLSFPKEYPGAKEILLSVNYRSHSEITDASLRLISGNKERFRKKLTSAKGKGGNVRKVVFPGEKEECAFVAEKIKGTENPPLHRIAVLTRTHTGMTSILKKFTEDGIPFYASERIPNIFLKPVVKPVFAILNYAIGDRSRGNFLKFMNMPFHGFTRSDAAGNFPSGSDDTDKQRTGTGSNASAEKSGNCINIARIREKKEASGDSIAARQIALFEMQLRTLMKLKTPYAMIHYFRYGMGYNDYLKHTAAERHADFEEETETLDAVMEEAKAFERVPAFYESVAAFSGKLQNENAKQKTAPKGCVFVTTLHAVKGLEYDTVFILDVNEKNMPHEKAILGDKIEEERRLFYVGMTRAEKELYLCSVKERYGRATDESRFLREIK